MTIRVRHRAGVDHISGDAKMLLDSHGNLHFFLRPSGDRSTPPEEVSTYLNGEWSSVYEADRDPGWSVYARGTL